MIMIVMIMIYLMIMMMIQVTDVNDRRLMRSLLLMFYNDKVANEPGCSLSECDNITTIYLHLYVLIVNVSLDFFSKLPCNHIGHKEI